VDSNSQSTITGSVFAFNTAGQSGGAVSQADSTSVVANSQFISNSGSTQGGAMFQNNMTGAVTDCRFLNNTGQTGVSISGVCSLTVASVSEDVESCSYLLVSSGAMLFRPNKRCQRRV